LRCDHFESGRLSGRLAFAFDPLAPSRGREQDRSEGMPSLGEAPNEMGKSPWLLGAFPSDPPSGRNLKWPLPQEWICIPSDPPGRCQAAIAGKPAPTGIEYDRNTGWLSGRHRWQASSYRNRVRPQYRLVVRPPSLASQLPQESSTTAIQVGCQAAIAGKPAPTGIEYERKTQGGCQIARIS
jgi:hypothetical protein